MTGQWNDITQGRVVQSAAVYALLLRLGRRARSPWGDSAETAVSRTTAGSLVVAVSDRFRGAHTRSQLASRRDTAGSHQTRRPDPGTAGQGHDEGWNPDNSNI